MGISGEAQKHDHERKSFHEGAPPIEIKKSPFAVF
jgi:hypothetical protein